MSAIIAIASAGEPIQQKPRRRRQVDFANRIPSGGRERSCRRAVTARTARCTGRSKDGSFPPPLQLRANCRTRLHRDPRRRTAMPHGEELRRAVRGRRGARTSRTHRQDGDKTRALGRRRGSVEVGAYRDSRNGGEDAAPSGDQPDRPHDRHAVHRRRRARGPDSERRRTPATIRKRRRSRRGTYFRSGNGVPAWRRSGGTERRARREGVNECGEAIPGNGSRTKNGRQSVESRRRARRRRASRRDGWRMRDAPIGRGLRGALG